MVKLIQIIKHGYNEYKLANVYLNPKHIVFMSEHYETKSDLREGKMNLDLDKNISFTKIKINENSATFSEIVVVGSPDDVESKIFNNKRKILRG